MRVNCAFVTNSVSIMSKYEQIANSGGENAGKLLQNDPQPRSLPLKKSGLLFKTGLPSAEVTGGGSHLVSGRKRLPQASCHGARFHSSAKKTAKTKETLDSEGLSC
jgi:hypothetical protein